MCVCVFVCVRACVGVCVCDSRGRRRLNTCARRARERRHNRLRGFLAKYIKSTGAVATSEQAVPLPMDSEPAAREARVLHTADIYTSERNG